MGEEISRGILGLALLPMGQIVPSPLNPRKSFDPEALEELAASIREHGLLEPIVVRADDSWFIVEGNIRPGKPSKWFCYSQRYVDTSKREGEQYEDGAPSFRYDSLAEAEANLPRYQIIAGERRYRAATMAGLEEIAATVRECDDREHLELALVENLVRRDIDPIEEAAGYRQLMGLGYRQADIAEKVNRSQPAIANAVRLLELPEDVQGLISSGQLSVSHGKALAKWKDAPAVVSALAAHAVSDGLPSKSIEGRLNYQQERVLFERGAAVDLSGFHDGREYVRSEFGWQRVCDECSHRSGHSLCLLPSCWREKRQAVLDARAAEEKRLLELAEADGDKLPKLCDLKDGSYERLVPRPAACSAQGNACGHVGHAMDGKRLVAICTKPACLKRLRAAEVKELKDAQRAPAEGRMTTAREVLAAATLENDGAFRRLLVVKILGAAPTANKGAIQAVSDRTGILLDPACFENCYHVSKHAGYFAGLAEACTLEQLLRLLGEMMIASNQRSLEAYSGANPEESDFIAGTHLDSRDSPESLDDADGDGVGEE